MDRTRKRHALVVVSRPFTVPFTCKGVRPHKRHFPPACERDIPTSPGAYLLYISTVEVYGDRLKAPMISADNMTCPSMGDYDALTKLQAEKLVQESSLEWTIYRPGIILGHDSSLLNSSVFCMPSH